MKNINTNTAVKTVKLVDVSLGEIGLLESGMPAATLVTVGGTVLGTVVPAFRGYCCQIDGSTDPWSNRSGGDLHSTQVFGWNNILDSRLGTDKVLGSQSNLSMASVKYETMKMVIRDTIAQGLAKLSGYDWADEIDGIEEGDEILFRYVETDAAVQLGDGRILGGGRETRLDLLVTYAIRWLNPSLYIQVTKEATSDSDVEGRIGFLESLDTLKGYQARELEALYRARDELARIAPIFERNPIA